MIKTSAFIALFATILVAFAAIADAKTIKIPEGKPVISVNVPDSWEPEATDKGIAIESPDKIVTVFFEVTSPKGMEELIDENVDWLMKDQKVEIDRESQSEKDFKNGDINWSRISWDGNNEEFGLATVGFLMTKAGNKILTVTYWITKKDHEKQMPALDKILSGVKILTSDL
jgi:hypothetical protein